MSWEVLLSSDGDGQAGNGNSHQFSGGLFKIGSFCETGKRVVHQVTLFTKLPYLNPNEVR